MKRDRSRSSLRESFRPTDVKILFIGESPPAGGTFFFAADSNLFRYTNAAFTNVYGARAGTGEDFLRSLNSKVVISSIFARNR